MRKATGKVSGKYNYNYTCPRCGFVHKFDEMKRMWYGVYVCKEDFETRHPLDFYRTLPDAHVLPQTSGDITELLSWTTFLTGDSSVVGVGTVTRYATYQATTDINNNNITNFFIQILITPNATWGIPVSATLTLPTVPTSGGTANVEDSMGNVKQKLTITAGQQTYTINALPQGTNNFKLTGRYGT